MRGAYYSSTWTGIQTPEERDDIKIGRCIDDVVNEVTIANVAETSQRLSTALSKLQLEHGPLFGFRKEIFYVKVFPRPAVQRLDIDFKVEFKI